MGAWIEICSWEWVLEYVVVAPLVGAWIEILPLADMLKYLESLPLWERGLKSVGNKVRHHGDGVAPLVGAWIEM